MLTICNIMETEPQTQDATYAIVRNLKGYQKGIKQLSLLSPSTELYHYYCQEKKQGTWTEEKFQEIYVPQFLKEMRSPEVIDKLNDILVRVREKNEDITLCCYCVEEQMCHRSIIAGLFQGIGLTVNKVWRDYSPYYDKWKQIEKQIEEERTY